MVDAIKKTLGMGTKILIGLISLLVVGFIIWGAVQFVNSDFIPKVGTDKTNKIVDMPNWLQDMFSVLLGISENPTWEGLVLYIAIFLILSFTFSEIVSLFSTFSETTSWVIGFGLAIIAGVTKIIPYLAGFFGLTAGVGAVGIIIIILASIFAAVVFNIGLGKTLRKWRWDRQAEIDAVKTSQGAKKASDAIRGLKEVSDSFK